MTANRSVPVDTLLPHVPYREVGNAIDWLSRTFGFVEHYRYGDPAGGGAQMYLGRAVFMLMTARPAQAKQFLTVFIQDVEGHCERARAVGAKIVEEPHETEYGEFQYAAEDLDGHTWIFARHARDRSPAEWGATTAYEPPPIYALLPRPRLCYLEIPATAPEESADFYEKVFGWKIRNRGTGRPSFDDATWVSGAWVSGREAAKPGLLPYIWVDRIGEVLRRVESSGGVVIEGPRPDHPGGSCLIALFRDPAGNVIGLYEEP
ncbi:MAG TPA: VOC family protein [Bryobacteraceae bacterium]|nr:VOC family protein [Bryobacteraceae bacterium]